MATEVEFNSLAPNDDAKVKLQQPSHVNNKPSDEEVAKYSKTRLVLVIIFGILIIAMVVAAVVIIIVSPKCPVKKPPVDREWFKDDIVYQVDPTGLKLKGIIASLDDLDKLGVKIIRLNSIYPTDNQKNDILDHTAIEKKIGNMTDFDELVKKAHEKGMKIVVDFVPNHTSKEHKWFIESAMKKDSKKRNWYIWRPSDNNWPSVTGGSAWEQDSTTNEYYLHQFEKYKPDLNLRNEEVVEALKKVLKFWVDKGVDGFRALDVQYLLENDKFSDEKVISKPQGNESMLYNMTEHSQTFGKYKKARVYHDVLLSSLYIIFSI